MLVMLAHCVPKTYMCSYGVYEADGFNVNGFDDICLITYYVEGSPPQGPFELP